MYIYSTLFQKYLNETISRVCSLMNDEALSSDSLHYAMSFIHSPIELLADLTALQLHAQPLHSSFANESQHIDFVVALEQIVHDMHALHTGTALLLALCNMLDHLCPYLESLLLDQSDVLLL